jgi:hypothetical protein
VRHEVDDHTVDGDRVVEALVPSTNSSTAMGAPWSTRWRGVGELRGVVGPVRPRRWRRHGV